MTSGADYIARQGAFPQEYFVYFKEKQRGMAKKSPPIGRVDVFQTRPNTLILFISSYHVSSQLTRLRFFIGSYTFVALSEQALIDSHQGLFT